MMLDLQRFDAGKLGAVSHREAIRGQRYIVLANVQEYMHGAYGHGSTRTGFRQIHMIFERDRPARTLF